MLEQLLNSRPAPVPSESARDASFYRATVTLYDEQSTGMVAMAGMVDMPCRRYPQENTREIETFETTRNYTDRIRVPRYLPRANSSHFAALTEATGEVVWYEVRDVEHDGVPAATTLLVRRRGLDGS